MRYGSAVALALVGFILLPPEASAGPVEDELKSVDKSFSDMSAAKGFPAAFLAYIADDVRLFGTGGEPLVGKAKVAAEYASPQFQATRPNEAKFTWSPVEAFASPDGKLGWTNGHWKLVAPPGADGARAETTGHYITIWREGADGWKIVGDIGTRDAPPSKAK